MVEWLTVAFRILGKIPGMGAYVSPVLERQRFRKVAVDVAALSFWKEGMISCLEKIASGHGDQNDLRELSEKLAKTEPGLKAVVKRLKFARVTLVGTELGLQVAQELDDIINAKIGPRAIRPTIKHLIESGRPDKATAEDILSQIDNFRKTQERVHELIRKRAIRPATPARKPTRKKP
jgi:hypothetical protein